MMQRRVLLDASAITAWLFRETGDAFVAEGLPHASMAVPNVIEAAAVAKRKGFTGSVHELVEGLELLGLNIENVTSADVRRAAELLVTPTMVGRISLGDAMCISVAERLALPIITGDRAWLQFSLTVPVYMFRA